MRGAAKVRSVASLNVALLTLDENSELSAQANNLNIRSEVVKISNGARISGRSVRIYALAVTIDGERSLIMTDATSASAAINGADGGPGGGGGGGAGRQGGSCDAVAGGALSTGALALGGRGGNAANGAEVTSRSLWLHFWLSGWLTHHFARRLLAVWAAARCALWPKS